MSLAVIYFLPQVVCNAQSQGRLQWCHVLKSRDAGPINFIGWFGPEPLLSAMAAPVSFSRWLCSSCQSSLATDFPPAGYQNSYDYNGEAQGNCPCQWPGVDGQLM
jgi:hypothetical protein